jgi:S-adenosylmethionine hydrolase
VPIVTLTTDFGTRDPFVGVMKGVILSIAPEACLVDLTHEIPPHDVLEGALALEAALGFFPAGTVHLAVVDPGVGSGRRGLAVAAGGQLFVAPDNGLLTPVFLGNNGGWRAVSLEAVEYRLPRVSRTFHGRDVFAPAAAHLAAGTPIGRLGPPVSDPLLLPWPVARPEGDVLAGEVVHADRFGNLVTSVRLPDLAALGALDCLVVEVGKVQARLVGCYADLSPGEVGALVGSTDRLEIAAREGSALRATGLGRGAPVKVRKR